MVDNKKRLYFKPYCNKSIATCNPIMQSEIFAIHFSWQLFLYFPIEKKWNIFVIRCGYKNKILNFNLKTAHKMLLIILFKHYKPIIIIYYFAHINFVILIENCSFCICITLNFQISLKHSFQSRTFLVLGQNNPAKFLAWISIMSRFFLLQNPWKIKTLPWHRK